MRSEYATGLHAEAARRFGAERAAALQKTIEDVAGWMAEVATFPVDGEELWHRLLGGQCLSLGGYVAVTGTRAGTTAGGGPFMLASLFAPQGTDRRNVDQLKKELQG